MAFGLSNDKRTPAPTTSTKAGSLKQHLKRWMGWRRKRNQHNTPSIQYNNYLMLSSCTDESTHHCTPSHSPPIPKDDQNIITESIQSGIDHLQQKKPHDEGLARLSNCTANSSQLDYTLPSDSYSPNKAASTNRHRPALIDTNNIRTKIIDAPTYNQLTGPLTTSAFSDITNSTETSPISATSVQQALPLSPSWDPELQQGRDASLIDSDLSTLSNSLSIIGSASYAQPKISCNDGDNQLESEWLADAENEDDANNNDPLCTLDNNTISTHDDDDDDDDDGGATFSQHSSSSVKRNSICAWSTTLQGTAPSTWGLTSTSTFFTSSASPTSISNKCTKYVECDYDDYSPPAKMDDPGSTTSFFTTNSSFTQQDLEDCTDATRSSLSLADSSLDKDTVLLVTHAVNFLKSREDSSWDDDDQDDNLLWPSTQMRLDALPTAAKTSCSTKARHADITPSPSTSTVSTLVPSGGRKIASLQDKNINDIPDRMETTDEEIHRIVSTHILF